MEARELWGQLSGYCNTMVGLPQVLTQAVAVAMVPAIAAAYKLRNRAEIDENINLGMRISMIIGMPCAAGMIALAEPYIAASLFVRGSQRHKRGAYVDGDVPGRSPDGPSADD